MINHHTLFLNYRLCLVTGCLCLMAGKCRCYWNRGFLLNVFLPPNYDNRVMAVKKFKPLITTTEKLKNQIPIALLFKS